MVVPVVRALYRDIMHKAERFDQNAALKTLPKHGESDSISVASRITKDLFGSSEAVAYRPDSRKATDIAREWFRRNEEHLSQRERITEAFESIKVMNTLLKIEDAWAMQSCDINNANVPSEFNSISLKMNDDYYYHHHHQNDYVHHSSNDTSSISHSPFIRPGTVLLAHPMLNLTLFRFSCILITDVDPQRGTKGVIVNLPYTEYIRQENSAMKFWHDDLSYSYLRESLVPFTEDMMRTTGFEGDFETNDTTDLDNGNNKSNHGWADCGNIYYHQDNHHSSKSSSLDNPFISKEREDEENRNHHHQQDLFYHEQESDSIFNSEEEPVAFDDTLVQQMKESMWDEYGKAAGSKIDSVVSQILHSAAISPLIKDDSDINNLQKEEEKEGERSNTLNQQHHDSDIKQTDQQEDDNSVDPLSYLQDGFNVGSKLGFSQRIMLHYGGPFEERQSTFLIRDPQNRLSSFLDSNSALQRIHSDLFICRDLNAVQKMSRTCDVAAEDVKALQGCVMWEPGQLEKEAFREKLWFAFDMPSSLITYHSKKEQQLMWMWSNTMKAVGGEYRHLGNWYSKLLPNGCMMNISTKEIASNILRSLPQAEIGTIRTK